MRTNQILDDKPSYPFTLFGLVVIYLIFRFTFFSSSFHFAALFGLLPGFFRVEEFPTKRKLEEARTIYHGQAKSGKGNALSFSLKF